MVLKLGHFGKHIRNIFVLKYGAGERWRSVGRIVWKVKQYYIQSRSKKHPAYNKTSANWICHVWRRSYLPKHVTEGNIEVTGRRERRGRQLLDDFKAKRRYRSLRKKHYIALCGEGALEQAKHLSQERLGNEWMKMDGGDISKYS